MLSIPYPSPTRLCYHHPLPHPTPPSAGLSILYPELTVLSASQPPRAVYPLPHPPGLLCPYLGAFVLVTDRVNPASRTLWGYHTLRIGCLFCPPTYFKCLPACSPIATLVFNMYFSLRYVFPVLVMN